VSDAAATGRGAAVVAVLLASLCFATTGTAQALADVDASPVAVGLARIALGGVLLGLAALWLARTSSVGPATGEGSGGSLLRRLPTSVVVAVGATGVLAYQPTFFEGTERNGVAAGTVVALGSAPVVTGVLDALLSRRAPTLRWCVATVLALLGVVCVAGLLDGGASTGAAVLWSVGAGGSYALYTLAAKELLGRGWSAARTMGVLFGVAGVVSLPVLAVLAGAWLLTPAGLVLVVWLGVVTTTVAYLLFGWGLARLPAPEVATLTLAEPLCATLLGVGLLDERLGLVAGVGLLVLAAGLALLATGAREPAAVRGVV
jgi:DME family drug/metabolite transporter